MAQMMLVIIWAIFFSFIHCDFGAGDVHVLIVVVDTWDRTEVMGVFVVHLAMVLFFFFS
jgi:hypothetical protein